jgi:hypothetical protein
MADRDFSNSSSGRMLPAVNTDAVFMKFLRVEFMMFRLSNTGKLIF